MYKNNAQWTSDEELKFIALTKECIEEEEILYHEFVEMLSGRKIISWKEVLLKISRYNQGDICPICMIIFNPEEEVMILNCDHVFHRLCIWSWIFRENYGCPCCRKI